MRKLMIFAACASLALTAGEYAWSQDRAPLPPVQTQTEPAQTIRSVKVLDMGSLPPEVRAKVNALAAQTSPDDLQALRTVIDATPMASLALKEKGLSSAQVIAASMDEEDGSLTLIADVEI